MDKPVDFVGEIMDYENGMMNHDQTVEFFQNLVDSGLIWNMQGHYQRTAQRMIEAGEITYKGEESR